MRVDFFSYAAYVYEGGLQLLLICCSSPGICYLDLEKMLTSLVDNLIGKTYLADVSTGCSSPPQGESEAESRNLTIYRLFVV